MSHFSLIQQVLRFLGCGGLATLVHWLVFAILSGALFSGMSTLSAQFSDLSFLHLFLLELATQHANGSFSDSVMLSPLAATSYGAVSGAIVNYYLQRSVVFNSQGSHRRTLPRYILSVGLSFLFNALIFALLQNSGLFSLLMAQVVTTVCVMFMNFVLYKRLVFHESPTSSSV
ncbi:MAG: GtrA family protein [Pelistega sp.]|nr:GtrA family protein [Pelistega sp.]